MKKIVLVLLFIAYCPFVFAQTQNTDSLISLQNQFKDYEVYPEQNFRFIDASIDIFYSDEEKLIKGKVKYQVQPLLEETDEIRLLALRMQIDGVQINNHPVTFSLQNDTLIIRDIDAGNSSPFSLEILYQTDLIYGFLKDQFGTIRTSNRPFATAHYLPGFIHPRNQLPILARFDIPANLEVVAPGERITAKTDKQSNRRIVEWKSNITLAITDFKFAIGDFEVSEAQFGFKKIRFFANKNEMNPELKTGLMKRAYQQLLQSERILGREYPYESFSIVVQNDAQMETKTFAASLGFLYQSIADLNAQIDRVVAAQWFGEFRQPVNTQNAELSHLFQAWLVAALRVENGSVFAKSNEEANKTGANLSQNSQSKFLLKVDHFLSVDNEFWFKIFSKTAASILNFSYPNLTEQDYLNVLYVQSGRIFYGLNETESSPMTASADSVKAEFVYDELTKTLHIKLSANENNLPKWPLTVQVELVTTKGNEMKSMKWEKNQQEITVKSNNEIQNGFIKILENEYVVSYKKPVSFWITQVRNDKMRQHRLTAVNALSDLETEPDFQLILFDLFKAEKDPEVLAGLIHLYAQLTKGAVGTDQFFLEKFRSDNSLVKNAALAAFAYFPEDEAMYYNARSVLRTSQDPALKRTALTILEKRMSESEFSDLISQNLQSEKQADFIPTLLQWVKPDSTGKYSEQNNALIINFTQDHFPFQLRFDAMSKLCNNESWVWENEDNIISWFSDLDPQIRYAMLNILPNFPSDYFGRILKDRLSDEFDFRIRDKLKELSR